MIRPAVRSTRRPGADGEIGGFGGVFDLKAAGFSDPVLVAANDGVGTKVKIAIESGLHDTIGIDLVAMCVNDLIVQGAEPLFFLDYYATGKLDPKVARRCGEGHRRRLRRGGLRPARRRDGGNAGPLFAQATTISPASPSARRSASACCRATSSRATSLFGLPSSGVHSNGYSLVRRIVKHVGPLPGSATAPFARRPAISRSALLDADPHLREAAARGA